MTTPLVQSIRPRKLANGWRLYLEGFNLSQVLGVRVGSSFLSDPVVQTDRELVVLLPVDLVAGAYTVTLEGLFGELEVHGVTVVELVDLDARLPQAYTFEDYAQQLLELLPKGPAWTRVRGSNFWKLFTACGLELARLHDLAAHLLEELTPSQTVDSLLEWEEELGLPESCVLSPSSDEAVRRKEIFRKANSLGGSSPAYFEELASLLGFTVRVEEFFETAAPFKVGTSTVGQALTSGPWLFAWKVVAKIPEGNVQAFTVGNSTVGQALRWWGLEELECFLDKLKPAHTVIVYGYTYGEDFFMVGHDGGNMIGSDGSPMVGRT